MSVCTLYVYRRDTVPLIKQYLELGQPKDAPGHFPSWLCSANNPCARRFTPTFSKGECVDIGTPKL